MDETSIAQTLIRLVNERPTGVWYLRKSHYPTVDWAKVAELVTAQGYDVSDTGEIVKGSTRKPQGDLDDRNGGA